MKSPDKDVYLGLCRADFQFFAQEMFRQVYPGEQMLPNWHIEVIAGAVLDCIEGRTKRLLVNLPPRHLKSFLMSVAAPAFMMGHDPSVKLMAISYSDELAKSLMRDFRRIVESPLYRTLFPGTKFTKFTENEAVTSQNGWRYAATLHGTLTGRGADGIIIDDPSKPKEALSDKQRNDINHWFGSTLLSRLNQQDFGFIVIVMQRLHVNDLAGYVEEAGGFRKLSFSAIATKTEQIVLPGGRIHVRKAGEALQEEHVSLKRLKELQQLMGPALFAAQYQQAPAMPEGCLFKQKHFVRVPEAPPLTQKGQFILGIDSALSTSASADFSALTLLYKIRDRYYVMNCWRQRLDFEELKDLTLKIINAAYAKLNKRIAVAIESAGSGVSLYLALTKLQDERMEIRRYPPKEDKMFRAAMVLPIIAQKPLFVVDIPGRNAWVDTFLQEFLTFPNGRYNDQVDSVTHVLPWAEVRFRYYEDD